MRDLVDFYDKLAEQMCRHHGMENDKDAVLYNNLLQCNTDIKVRFPWADFLTPARRGVLVDLAMWLEIEELSKRGLFLHLMRDEEWSVAAVELMNQPFATQSPTRLITLVKILLTGEWNP